MKLIEFKKLIEHYSDNDEVLVKFNDDTKNKCFFKPIDVVKWDGGKLMIYLEDKAYW